MLSILLLSCWEYENYVIAVELEEISVSKDSNMEGIYGDGSNNLTLIPVSFEIGQVQAQYKDDM